MTQVYCRSCGESIHPMRLEILPNTTVCVTCSQEVKKVGKIVTYGTGEEIETALEILDPSKAKPYVENNAVFTEENLELFSIIDDDADEEDTYVTYSNVVKTLGEEEVDLDSEEIEEYSDEEE